MNVRKKVRFLDSISVLADPKPKEVLDEKYAKIRQNMEGRRPRPFSAPAIEEAIRETKGRDRYGEPELGFPRDVSFKPDQEAMIDARLAEKWADAGICVIIEDARAARAA